MRRMRCVNGISYRFDRKRCSLLLGLCGLTYWNAITRSSNDEAPHCGKSPATAGGLHKTCCLDRLKEVEEAQREGKIYYNPQHEAQ